MYVCMYVCMYACMYVCMAGPIYPSAMVFWLCDTTLGPELCQTKASKLAASSAGRQQIEGLKLVLD